MAADGFALFDTAIGRCGIAWGERGVAGVQLPEGRDSATRARLAERFPEAREARPPEEIRLALERIVALLGGEVTDLGAIGLDLSGVPPFHRRVYDVARTIAAGATLSYGDIAARLGVPTASRAVGQALGRNPFAIVVPCHRVLASNGRLGGFSSNGGVVTKLRLLAIESAACSGASAVFEGDGELGFDPAAASEHLRRADAGLARIVDAVGPCRLRLQRADTLFLALAEAIVFQQLNGRAAATIFARLKALFPYAPHTPTAAQILGASDERLRSAGLSRSKLLSLRDLATKAKRGDIPALADVRTMPDEAIIEALTQVRGIGRWTVQMLLIFRLGRPDVLPVDDYGVRKGFQVAFRKRALPTKQVLERHAARWKPYRTVASWYMWRAADRDRKEAEAKESARPQGETRSRTQRPSASARPSRSK